MKFITAFLTSLVISVSAFAYEVGDAVMSPGMVGCINEESALKASKQIAANGFNEEAFLKHEGCGNIPPGVEGVLQEKLHSFIDQNVGALVNLWRIETPYGEVFYSWIFEEGQAV